MPNFVLILFTESAHWNDSFLELRCPSVCVSVCLCHRKTPSSGGCGEFWSKNMFLIFACYDTILKKRGLFSHLRSLFPKIAETCGFEPTPTFWCCEDLWLKKVFLILVFDDTIVNQGGVRSCTLGSLVSEIANMYGFRPTPTSGC